MEHPLIKDISDLTETQLTDKINELNKKYMIAQRSGNAHLCNQILMALETYRNKRQEIYNRARDTGHEDKIDIS
jgi:hypothetical protein